MKISFIGFGEAGYGLTKGLKQAGMEEVYFIDRLWDTLPYGDVIMKRAAETGAIMKKISAGLRNGYLLRNIVRSHWCGKKLGTIHQRDTSLRRC